MGARVIGGILIVLGLAVLSGWTLQLSSWVRILPGFAPMAPDTAASFVVAGVAIAWSPGSLALRRMIAIVAGAVLVLIAASVSLRHPEWERAIGLAPIHSWLPEAKPISSRMSAPTAWAFALAGAAFVLTARAGAGLQRQLPRALAFGVGAIGVLGIAGYLVQARLLFPDYSFTGMAAHTASGLILLAIGLVHAQRRFEWGRGPLFAREDDQVTFVAAMVLATIAIVAGIAAFAILQDRVQIVVADNVLTSLRRRSETIQDVLELREINARIAATRPAVLRNLRVIRARRDDGSNLANVRSVVANFLEQGFSGLAYLDADGATVASGGAFALAPTMVVSLTTPAKAELLWDNGFVLRHRLALRDAEGEAGSVLVEQPLPVITRLAQGASALGTTADMGLCVGDGDRLRCFPQRLNPAAFTTPTRNLSGEPLPMAHALRGESGTVITRDYRNQIVVAAYGPVGNTGLGMVVKIEAAEVFHPIREQLQWVLLLLVVLVAVGTLLLRGQVKPFATRLFEAKHSLEEKNVELARASAAKDRFLASMSHELRTPLNAIIGFTGTLLMKLPGPLNADQERQLGTVQASARHLLSLINDLLDLAKIDSGKVELELEPVACGEVLEEVAATLRPNAESKGLRLLFDPPAAAVRALADRRALSQILINLTNNAIKFTEHGSVRLRVDGALPEGGGTVEIAVEDTGVGICPDDHDKLFKPFTRIANPGARPHEGTGLGLHLSEKLAGLMQGRIRVASEPGKGSVFTVILREAS